MASSIGIKIANGEFYPVLEEGSSVKKRLVLTTVHDGQRSVQIDLYRSDSRSMADASYIGSLVVENIAEKLKGEPSIELVIGSDGTDELRAEAVDLDADESGNRQQLSVLLQSMEDGETYEVPDFELESETPAAPPAGLYPENGEDDEKPSRGSFPIVPVLAAALAVLLAGGLLFWLLVLNKAPEPTAAAAPAAVKTETPAPTPPDPLKAEPPKTAPVPVAAAPVKVEPAKPAEPPPVSKTEAAARRARPAAPVKSYKVPKTIPKEGFRYRIRWGDTLWDISEAFYRNPWLYPRIARFNKIRNPDLIISGTHIRIPPKN